MKIEEINNKMKQFQLQKISEDVENRPEFMKNQNIVKYYHPFSMKVKYQTNLESLIHLNDLKQQYIHLLFQDNPL